MKNLDLVPSQEHYTNNYLGQDGRRLYSYMDQIRYVFDAKPQNALVIGRGDGIVADIIAKLGISIINLDIMPSPQITGYRRFRGSHSAG